MYFNSIRKQYFILVFAGLVLFTGCKSSVKQNFGDFRAYYNTYYNAKKSYQSGVNKNEAQNREYNALIPIRIHLEPVNAGRADFEVSIDKGADILRKFEESKWVDDAIEIIGKSYYYRQEYFSADQKFQELYQATESERLKQRSVYWRGRNYLEMQLNDQAIDYLQNEILVFGENWDKGLLAETKAILAQHYVAVENYELAEKELSECIDDLTTKEHKARGYFLYGQLLELNGKPEEAYDAYDGVGKYYRDYNLFFEANVKKGQVARDLGLNEESFELFESLGKDDKNFTVKADLDYELGQALQADGQFEEAKDVYLSVLRNTISKPSNVTIAKTYYGLAEISRYYYNDFKLAASYYDSASSGRVDEEELPEGFDAAELFSSFGEYVRLRESIELNDSLLWLGQLPEAELDSVVLELKKKRKKELEEQLREAEARKNTLVTVSQREQTQNRGTATNGFLNFKNPLLIADARSQFQAIWGDRPLVDNWRRFNSIVIEISDSTQTETSETNIYAGNANIQLSDIQIDLSAVPFLPEDRDSVNNLVANEYYELGNLFFLSLQMPDSAEHYFIKVIEEYPDYDATSISYYSLSELLYSLDELDLARDAAEELIQFYPESEYAKRLAERYQVSIEQSETRISEADSLKLVYDQLSDLEVSAEKADSLRSFANIYSDFYLSPRIMLDAAFEYSELAKDSVYYLDYEVYDSARVSYQYQLEQFEVYKDSIRVLSTDTTLTLAQQAVLNVKLDSTFKKPDYDKFFPYFGEYWDSTRVVLEEFKMKFSDSQLIDPARRLSGELTIPEIFLIVEQSSDSINTDSLITDVSADSLTSEETVVEQAIKYLSCRDLRLSPEIEGGIQAFIESLEIYVYDTTQRYFMTYKFKISTEGEVVEYNLERANVDEEFRDVIEEAIEDRLKFIPLTYQDEAIPVECDVTFDLSATE